jgi:hypothetical protein
MSLLRLRVALAAVCVLAGTTATLASGTAAPSVQLALKGLSGSSRAKNGTCQAGDTRKATKHTIITGDGRKTITVVACEQPPRSELVLPSTLKSAVSTALATEG